MLKNKPLVSVVILSWNTLDDTKVTLDSLSLQSYENIEIVVVDNGSDDGSKAYLEKISGITYVDLEKNTGFTGGQIAALDKCRGSYVVLLNSDAVLDSDWVKIAVEALTSDPKLAAIGGKAFEWNEKHAAYDTDSPFYSYQRVDLNLGYATTLRTGESRVDVDSISGAAVMISMDAIRRVGYFDDRFFAYFEETDLFARFQKSGYKIVYEPTLHAWHQIAKSSKSEPYFYLYQMHRNRFMFGFKNFDHPWRFLMEYTVDYVRAKRRLSRDDSMDDKARIAAYKWNVVRLPNLLRLRRQAGAISYDSTLRNHHPGDDVTIIIPSYNYERYLAEAIESAINQSHGAKRIIVIDDGSKDKSVKIAKGYSEVEVVSKKNEGVILTKNLGIDMSSTSWTIFLDADDVLQLNYVEEMLAESKKRPVDVVYCDMEYTGNKSGVFRSIEFSVDKLTEGNFIHNSSLINTSLLKSIGGFKTEMRGGYEDWELYLSLAEAGASFAYCRSTHLQYRQHGGSLGRNNSATKNADKLLAQVRQLHTPLYSRADRNKSRRTKLLRLIIKHPETVFVALTAIPVSLVLGLKGYVKDSRRRFIRIVRTYIHKVEASDKPT